MARTLQRRQRASAPVTVIRGQPVPSAALPATAAAAARAAHARSGHQSRHGVEAPATPSTPFAALLDDDGASPTPAAAKNAPDAEADRTKNPITRRYCGGEQPHRQERRCTRPGRHPTDSRRRDTGSKRRAPMTTRSKPQGKMSPPLSPRRRYRATKTTVPTQARRQRIKPPPPHRMPQSPPSRLRPSSLQLSRLSRLR